MANNGSDKEDDIVEDITVSGCIFDNTTMNTM